MPAAPPPPAEPLVDVGIPTHGRPHYLVEAIECVLAQSFDRWRLVVSEDGPGEAAGVVEPYLRDPRVRYLASEERLGAQGNHTKLLTLGGAPYVAFLHDDDLWERDFLTRRVAFLEANPDCGFVFSANTQIDEHGPETGRSRPVVPEGVHLPEEFAPLLLRRSVVGGIHTALARRAAYEAVGARFDERFAFFDWEMWLRLALRFPVGYLALWDVAYRVHGEQISVQGRWGEQRIAFYEHLDALVEQMLPAAALSPSERRSRRSSAFLSAALDAIEAAERRRALARLGSALLARPRAVLDARVPGLVLGLALGRPGRRALLRLRGASRRRGLREGVERSSAET